MEIKLKTYRNFYIVELIGQMDMYNAYKLKEIVQKMIFRQLRLIIIDMGKVTYIDSSGVGALLHSYSSIVRSQGELRIVNVVGPVKRVIELTKLLGFLPITDSIRSAIKQMSSHKTAKNVK